VKLDSFDTRPPDLKEAITFGGMSLMLVSVASSELTWASTMWAVVVLTPLTLELVLTRFFPRTSKLPPMPDSTILRAIVYAAMLTIIGLLAISPLIAIVIAGLIVWTAVAYRTLRVFRAYQEPARQGSQ
jgi:hypothetical protein